MQSLDDFATRKLAELGSKSAAPLEGLGLAQARVGAYDDAPDSIAKALEIEPRSAQS